MIRFLLFLFGVFSLQLLNAQCGISGGPVCYSSNSSRNLIVADLCPNPGEIITLNFTAGEVESSYDELEVYAGTAPVTYLSGTLIYSGYGSFGDLTGLSVAAAAADQCLSVYVNADGTVNCSTNGYDGIELTTSCSLPVPVVCEDMTISTTTYSNTGLTTSGFGDDYSSADACGSSYMNGDDIVIEYIPNTTECVNVSLSNTASWVGVFILDDCPDASGASCLASNTSSTGNPSISGFNVISGNTYYIVVSTYPTPQSTSFDLDIVACPPAAAGDDCSSALDLSLETSPYFGSNTNANGYSNNYTGSCLTSGANDFIAFIDVADGEMIEIAQTANSFDSEQRVAYGGACPGTSEIDCWDESDLKNICWTNTTGSTQRVYYVIDGYYVGSQGTFTLEWSISSGTTSAGNTCAGAVDLGAETSPFSGSTSGCSFTDNVNTSCLSSGANDFITFIDVPNGYLLEIGQTSNNFDSEQRIAYGGSCPGTTEIDCWDEADTKMTCWTNTTGSTQRVYYVVDAFSATGTGDFTLEWNLNPGTTQPGNTCSAAIDLSIYAGTYSGSTANCGMTDEYASSCLTSGANDFIVYIDIDDGEMLSISQSSNTFDSEQRIAYGGACPGVNEINCWDEEDTQITCWSNTTGSTQRVYYVIDGYSVSSVGDFVLEWEVTPIGDNAGNNCSNAVNLALETSPYLGTTEGCLYTNDFTHSCLLSGANDFIAYIEVADGETLLIGQLSNDFDSEQLVAYGGSCPGTNIIDCWDVFDTDFIIWENTTGIAQNVYYIVDGYYSSDVGNFELQWLTGLLGCTNPSSANYDPNATIDDGSCLAPSCGTNPPPANTCDAAPLISNLNGYCGTTLASYTVDCPNNLCTEACFGSMDNNSFISFIADSTTVGLYYWIDGDYYDCDDGIQIEVFEVSGACTSGTWTSVSTCLNPSGGAGSSGLYIINNLVVGNTYYILVDGYAGDVCDYTWSVTTGVLTCPLLLGAETVTCHSDGSFTVEVPYSGNNDGTLYAASEDTDGSIITTFTDNSGGSGTFSLTYPVGFTTDYSISISGGVGGASCNLDVIGANPNCPYCNANAGSWD